MTSDWVVSSSPSEKHEAWARQGGFLFASGAWSTVLAALGAQSVFAWSESRQFGLLVPVFRRLGVRIGFLGFPVSATPLDDMEYDEFAAVAHGIIRCADLGMLRVTRSGKSSCELHAVSARPEVWIEDLASWSPQSKRLKKDLAFARRASTDLEILDGCSDPESFHDLYAATVAAHGGKQNYTKAYFSVLSECAASNSLLQCFSAVERQGRLSGVAVLARHGGCGYYLHGAASLRGKRAGVSDLLLSRVLQHAREMGCRRFSLMSSPWSQPGLVSFKEKWGEARGLTVTHDFARGLRGAGASLVACWQARHDRRKAAEWSPAR